MNNDKMGVNVITKIYKKYQEIINYLIVGFLTVLVTIIAYAIFTKIFHIYYVISNILSWIIAVLFAYYANSKYVFDGNMSKKEIIEFYKYRILSLIVDLILMYLLVDILLINDLISKMIVQIIVIVLNYIFSKYLIFKK